MALVQWRVRVVLTDSGLILTDVTDQFYIYEKAVNYGLTQSRSYRDAIVVIDADPDTLLYYDEDDKRRFERMAKSFYQGRLATASTWARYPKVKV